jgi:hypothetical protein
MPHNNIAIVLRFGGVREVLYGGDGTYAPGGSHVAINCIDLQRVGSLREEMPKFGGVAKPSGLSFTLVDRHGALSELFSATVEQVKKATLAVSLPAETETAVVTCNEPIEADADWTSNGFVYVGQETIAYALKDGNDFVISVRGALDSVISEHVVDSTPARSWTPIVSKYPVFWKGRKAIVTLHEVRANGTIDTNGQELLRGFVTAEPTPDEGQWSVTVVQETGKFDQELGDARFATTLVEGWHYFDGQTAKKLFVGESLPEGSVIRGFNAETADGFQILFNDGTVQRHRSLFGTIRGNYPGGPSNGPIAWPNDEIFNVVVDDYDNPLERFLLADPLPDQIGPEHLCVNEYQERAITVNVASAAGLQRWPDEAIAAFNDRANVTQTANGEFWYLDCVLSNDGASLLVQCGFPFARDNPPVFFNYQNVPPTPRFLHFPLFRMAEDADRSRRRDIAVRNQVKVGFGAKNLAANEDNGAEIPLIPAPLGFYQAGERYILIRDNLFPSVDEENPAVAIVRDSDGSEVAIEVDEVVSVNDPNGGFVGYRVRLTERSRTGPDIRSWENTAGSKVTIVPFVEFRDEDPRRLLLKIMLSGFSSAPGFPDANYSVLPTTYGLRIEPEAVDVAAFLAFPVPAPLRRLTFRPVKPVPARELIDPILQAIGAAIVPANVAGLRKLSLVRARATTDALAVDVIENGDWIAKARPGQGRLDEVVNVFRIFSNYDAKEDKFQVQANFEDATSIDAYGQQNAVEIKIRGLQLIPEGVAAEGVQAHEAFVTLYKTLRAMGAFAVPVFTGDLKWSVGRALTVGRTVLATVLEAYDGNRRKGTIVRKGMLVRAIELNPVDRTVRVDLLYRGRRTASFAPSARIVRIVDADRVELSTHTFSDATHPISGATQNDWTFFANDGTIPPGGVPVECVHVGAEEDNTNNTITLLDSATGIATIPAHGLAVGDRLRPQAWDDAASFHKVYAFLSQNGVLGAADDPGFVYS